MIYNSIDIITITENSIILFVDDIKCQMRLDSHALRPTSAASWHCSWLVIFRVESVDLNKCIDIGKVTGIRHISECGIYRRKYTERRGT